MDIDGVDDEVTSPQQTTTTTTTTTTSKTTTKPNAKKPTTSTTTTATKKGTKTTTTSKKPKSKTNHSTDKVTDPFEGMDYYQVFGIDREATDEQIVKAYKKLALEHHPDRHPNDPIAASHFASISKMHQTLIDPRKRQFYNAHGPTTDMSDGFLNAYELWKQTCPDLTPDDTTAFRLKYEDTEEEYTDVIAAFTKCKGDMYKMMKDELFFSQPETHQRDQKMVEMLIERGDINNAVFITKFKATAPTAGEKLAVFVAEQKKLHEEMEAKAYERALKKSKDGKVSDFALMFEMRTLAHEGNRKTGGADTLENIALSLGAISGAKEEAEAAAEAGRLEKGHIETIPGQKKATTGGRMASKKNRSNQTSSQQEKDQKVRPSDLDSSDDSNDDNESFDTKPNQSKRKLSKDQL